MPEQTTRPIPGSPAWLNQDNPTPALPPEDAALLAFLRALRAWQEAEAQAQARVEELQAAAKAAAAGVASLAGYPGAHVITGARDAAKAAREKEGACWRALPAEWQAVLDKLRPG
jgi:hypothetical protein